MPNEQKVTETIALTQKLAVKWGGDKQEQLTADLAGLVATAIREFTTNVMEEMANAVRARLQHN